MLAVDRGWLLLASLIPLCICSPYVVPMNDAAGDSPSSDVAPANTFHPSPGPSPSSQGSVVLYPISDAGGSLPSSFPFMEAISKPAGAALYHSDVIAANRWLCT